MTVSNNQHINYIKYKFLSLRRYKIFYSFLLIFMSLIGMPFASSASNSPIEINQISIDQPHHGIFIGCLVNDPDLVDKLTDESNTLTIDILTPTGQFIDVVIKHLEQVSDSKLELYLELPIQDALYRAGKKIYILKLKIADKYYESRIDATLGSTFKTYDLRRYSKSNIQEILTKTIFTLVIISIFLMLLQPLYQRFKFKQNHIKKYASVKQDDEEAALDPFTFVQLQDTDEVVVKDGQVLLLSSWKRLKEIPETQVAKDHEQFFPDQGVGTFFHPKSVNYKKINIAWYSVVGLCFGWLLFSLIVSYFVGSGSDFVSALTDNKSVWVSQYVTHEMLFGLCLGLCFGMTIVIADAVSKKSFKIDNSQLFQPIIRVAFVLLAMFFQVLVNTIIMEYTAKAIELISWLALAVGLNFPLDFKYRLKNKLIVGVLSGCIAFSVYQLLSVPYIVDLIGVNLASLISILSLGLSLGLLTELTINKTTFKNKVSKLLVLKKENKHPVPIDEPLIEDENQIKSIEPKNRITDKKKTAIVEDTVESN